MCEYCDIDPRNGYGKNIISDPRDDLIGVYIGKMYGQPLLIQNMEGCTDAKINFCPMCGEPLKEPEPLTLDELKARDRRPVWISDGEFCGWTICKADSAKQVYFDDMLNLAVYLKDYGKTWLAFDREATTVVKRYLEVKANGHSN